MCVLSLSHLLSVCHNYESTEYFIVACVSMSMSCKVFFYKYKTHAMAKTGGS